ncbi:DNA mismatch repair protein MutS [Maritalea porphyrae]|uniref:DNA mismatch repair protein MutS n=1 Tax=Maritalea porphyrae TaxID=880732 RepID=UPI0022B02571|nr:DNA mismatch repair protein MutS [Maritalea porphyrae]MCZ4272199.1 DNA mismatch repair protein MutS [Maritalea porphyrae]
MNDKNIQYAQPNDEIHQPPIKGEVPEGAPDLQNPVSKKTGGAQPTPMMAQFFEIRAVNPGYLLFYRMGDFYELFFDDAEIASRALGIALTKRGKHLDQDIPMCGVPVHAAQDYLKKLISLGHRVAVCEQMENPAEAKKRGAKSVVKRDVVRLVTAGTLTEDDLLDSAANNYLASLAMIQHGDADFAICYTDISTGEMFFCDVSAEQLSDELARIEPTELIVAEQTHRFIIQNNLLPIAFSGQLAVQSADLFNSEAATDVLHKTFGEAAGPLLGQSRIVRSALAAAISYIDQTQKGAKVPLRLPQRAGEKLMQIDAATRMSLELLRTNRGETKGALRATMDKCITSAGSRLLSARLSAPLCDPAAIVERHNMVGDFFDNSLVTSLIRQKLKSTPDIVRGLTRLALGRGGPREMLAIHAAISGAVELSQELIALDRPSAGNQQLIDVLSNAPKDLAVQIAERLQDDVPMLPRDGGFVRQGFDPELDEFRKLATQSRQVIAALQARYADETGIKAIKVKHNNVLGFFVEVPASHGNKLMVEPLNQTFIHRQTLANAVRFNTSELSELQGKITHASDAALAIELSIFEQLRTIILDRTSALQELADALAELDVCVALGQLALEQNYCRPKIDKGNAFEIKDGRHPVVEVMLAKGGKTSFVANDCDLSPKDEQVNGALWLITGPNMGGKSTFLRQNALIAIMAQMGSFVPASAAHIGVIDRVFSRVGAADDIAHGRSTFMVEMVETAAILNRATASSLVVLDEIGRGTATFDGLSIAWAAVEALHENTGCRALFATHYHELTALSDRLDRVSNHTMKVREWEGDVVFLHEVANGTADRSYGIQVAKLAGLPTHVVERAQEVLDILEKRETNDVASGVAQLPLFAQRRPEPKPKTDNLLQNRINQINPDELTPRMAIDLLYELKKLSQKHAER